MSRKARTRAAAAALLALVAGGTLAFGRLGGTYAIFSAETENQNAVAQGSWIPAPTAGSISIGGAGNGQAVMNWTAGGLASSPSPNPVSGQKILFADGGSGASAACPGGTYSTTADTIGNGTTQTDSLTGSPFTDWWCYQVMSTSASNWTAGPSTFGAVRPLVPTSVAFSGNGNGNLDTGDRIVITFNQNVSLSGGPSGVCTDATNNRIAIGYSTCAAGTQGTVGTVTGLAFIKKTAGLGATIVAAGNQITATLTTNGKNVTTQAGEVFTAGSADVASTGGWTACTVGACQPSPSGSF